jgi:hypothetical protein
VTRIRVRTVVEVAQVCDARNRWGPVSVIADGSCNVGVEVSRYLRGHRGPATLMMAVFAAVLVGTSPAVARPVISNSTSHPQLAIGDLRAYDYRSGASAGWDTDTQWGAGSYSGTLTVPSSGAVSLGVSGDVSAVTTTNAWWNTSWRTRRCFIVTNPASYAVAAHPVSIVFDSTSDTANGWLAAGAADLRVLTGGTSPTVRPFDVVGPWPSVSSAVWVKVPPLAAGATTTVCLYYNNPTATTVLPDPTARYDPLYRVRSGTTTIADAAGNWVPDNPAPAGVNVNTGNLYSTGATIPLDASVPSGTSPALFGTERWDTGTAPEMRYRFTVAAGRPVRVRLLESEIYFATVGQRIFNVNVEGGPLELTNFDAAAVCIARGRPPQCGLAFDYPFATSGDGFIDVDFIHVTENPKVAAIEVLDETVLTAVAGTREGLPVTSGTWTSPVVDTGAGGVYGLTSAAVTLPAGSGITYQLATSTSASGPWTYLGPDGTPATSYDGTLRPIEYSADGRRYVRVRATLTGPGTATPVLDQLTVSHSLPVLARNAGGRAIATTATGTGILWAVRIKTAELSVLGAAARLYPDSTSVWGTTSLGGAFDGPPLTCCSATQFVVTAGTVTSTTPTPVTIPASGSPQGGLSLVVNRVTSAAATADLTARISLASTTQVELPLRLVLP